MLAAEARANPSMSADFERIAGWLSNEVVQGLAFNAGSMFDPPNELRDWRWQPDISLGLGSIPLNKKKFPAMEVPALTEKHPESVLPNSVTFPNLALHLRLGLPGRYDISLRGANMTVPKGYNLSPGTKASGQSNSIGVSLRRHFLGGRELPLLSVSLNYNHVKGYFNFLSGWERLEAAPGLFVDSRNTGRLEWNVNSYGLNAVLSRTYGMWTPFGGFGVSRLGGSMKTRLQADFATPLVAPAVGEASDRPEENSGRLIFGTQMDLDRVSFFFNGEMKAIGIQSGRAFIMQLGMVCPFRIGSSAFEAKGTHRLQLLDKDALAKEPWELGEDERVYLLNAPGPKRAKRRRYAEPEPELERDVAQDPIYKPAKWGTRDAPSSERKRRRRKDDFPDMILIQ